MADEMANFARFCYLEVLVSVIPALSRDLVDVLGDPGSRPG